jgi:hypothetical protein
MAKQVIISLGEPTPPSKYRDAKATAEGRGGEDWGEEEEEERGGKREHPGGESWRGCLRCRRRCLKLRMRTCFQGRTDSHDDLIASRCNSLLDFEDRSIFKVVNRSFLRLQRSLTPHESFSSCHSCSRSTAHPLELSQTSSGANFTVVTVHFPQPISSRVGFVVGVSRRRSPMPNSCGRISRVRN